MADWQNFDEAERRVIAHMVTESGVLPWRPIGELTEKTRYSDHAGFLLLAPELVDLDCNEHGVGMGYWDDLAGSPVEQQPFDGEGGGMSQPLATGGWLACKWSMQNDEWHEVLCHPTHYLRLKGATALDAIQRSPTPGHHGKDLPHD